MLKQEFPQTKMSVTSSHGLMVKSTDDEPDVEQVKDALLAANAAESKEGWDDRYHGKTRWLRACGESIWFVHNTAAKQAEEEEKRRKSEEENARIKARIDTVKRAKADSIRAIEHNQSVWKRKFHLSAGDKESARQLAISRFPNKHELFALKRHHQRSEAALIAIAGANYGPA